MFCPFTCLYAALALRYCCCSFICVSVSGLDMRNAGNMAHLLRGAPLLSPFIDKGDKTREEKWKIDTDGKYA
jgi:hypothetical protein